MKATRTFQAPSRVVGRMRNAYGPTYFPGATELSQPRNWRSFAACLQVDPEVFFPNTDNRDGLVKAQQICANCEVATHCLNFGKAIKASGVWGGHLLHNGKVHV